MKSPLLLFLTIVLAIGSLCSAAENRLELPAIFSDGMVLQRGEPVPVWGWAEPGAEVTVEFSGQRITSTAAADGRWEVKLDAMEAVRDGQAMTVSCGEENKTISDVLVGEVWLCSGQSNMTVWLGFLSSAEVMEVRYQPIVDFIDEEIATANDPLLRQFRVPASTSAFEELETGGGTWNAATSPEETAKFTGTGYFFGMELRAKLDVPVALIKCDYGGTLIEPWIPRSGFALFPALEARFEKDMATLRKKSAEWDQQAADRKYAEVKKKWEEGGKQGRMPYVQRKDPAEGPLVKTTLFNGMVHPLIPFGIKGAIWYQGESNSGNRAAEYAVLFEAMVRGWRQEWKKPDLPVYMAQLASFEKEGEGRQWLTEAQRRAVEGMKNTGLAVLNDVGETRDVHPKNKIDVGKRLALWALKHDYKQDVPAHSGPLYKSHRAKGDHTVVTFDHAGSGLMVGRKALLDEAREVEEPLSHFEVCQFLGDWKPARAEIVGNHRVKVWSDEVDQPKWVRYAWQADLDGTMLYNREGLPASIFTSEPNLMDLALRSRDRLSFFTNLKSEFGINAVTGSAAKTDELPQNIALNAKVKASSVFEDQSAEFAVDGDPKTGWASNKNAKKAWIEIPLGKRYRITHIGYQSRNGVFERVQSFKFDTGAGTLQLCYLDQEAQTEFQIFDIEDVESDTIRWSVLDARYGANTGAAEIAIYGVPIESPK